MANTGAKLPTAAATASEDPWLDGAWTAATAITSDNAVYAACTAANFDTSDNSDVLKAYTFDFSSIPAGATIDGVICEVNLYCATANAGSLALMQLTNTALAKVGTNQCLTPVDIGSSTATVITKGSSTDVWGNALTRAWVQHANFGVALGVYANAENVDAFVDYVTLNVYYTAAVGWTHIAKVNGAAAASISKIYTSATSTIAKICGTIV